MKEGNIYACSYLVCYGRSGTLGVLLPCILGQLARQFLGGLGLVASDQGWVQGMIVVIIEIFIQIHWFTCRKGFTGKRGWRWLLETTEWWKLTIILEKSLLVCHLCTFSVSGQCSAFIAWSEWELEWSWVKHSGCILHDRDNRIWIKKLAFK